MAKSTVENTLAFDVSIASSRLLIKGCTGLPFMFKIKYTNMCTTKISEIMMQHIPKINFKKYRRGSTLFLYCAVLSNLWNSFSAKMQLASNSFCLLPTALLSFHPATK